MNSCNSQRFLIFLRQTSKLQRLHRVNDHNSHYIPKTFSPHNAKWVVSLRQLERFTEDFAVQLLYLTHRLISDTLQTSFAQLSFLGRPLFKVFNSLRLATPLIFFCLSNEYSTRHFFAHSLADNWQAEGRGCYPFALLMRAQDEINNGLAARAFLSLARRVSCTPNFPLSLPLSSTCHAGYIKARLLPLTNFLHPALKLVSLKEDDKNTFIDQVSSAWIFQRCFNLCLLEKYIATTSTPQKTLKGGHPLTRDHSCDKSSK